MNTPDDFCQWCYDRGIRYSRPGPWAHAIDCPNRLPSQPETPSGPPDALPPKDEAQGETETCPFCKGQDFAAHAHEGRTPFVCPHCHPAQGETGTRINPDSRETTLEGWRLWCLEAERERNEASLTVSKYATAARVIALHLKAFCDEALPYDEMIADAGRKAAVALAAAEGERDELRAQLQKECDHEWEHVDDSFDHEFGTEQIHSSVCAKCGLSKPYEPETFGDEAI